MDIDHPIAPSGHEFLAEDAHEAGKADQIDLVAQQPAHDLGIERYAGGEVTVRHNLGWDSGFGGPLQPARFGTAGQNQDDPGRIARLLASFDQGAEIAAATRNEDSEGKRFSHDDSVDSTQPR